MKIGSHGSTFRGNILSAAVANVVIDKINKPEALKYISRIESYLKNKLIESTKDLIWVKEVQELGLMVGIEMQKDFNIEELKIKLIEKGLIVMITSNIIRILPSICITERDVNEACEILSDSIRKIEKLP